MRSTHSAQSTSVPTYRSQSVSQSTFSSRSFEESVNVSPTLHLTSAAVDLRADRVKQMHVPMYKGLTIDNILAEGRRSPAVSNYLPDEKDLHRLPRQWLANVIYTLVGESFQTWVTQCIRSRNDHIAEKQNLIVELDPVIAAAFNNSLNISSK